MLGGHKHNAKPFTPRPLLDHTPGVPLVIDTGLGAWRAQELYTFIEDGSYIDESTSQLEAFMMTWNAQRQSWAFLLLEWSRPTSGMWQVNYETATLPVTYWGVSSLRSTLWLLLHVLWVVVSLAVFATEMARLTPHALEAAHKQNAYLSNLMTHYSSFGRILASCGTCLQLVVLGVFFSYHYNMLHVVQLELQYNIYHDLHAGANFFLSARKAEPTSLYAESNGAELIEAGVPPWTHPEDNSGLEEYVEKVQQMRQLGFLYQLFFMLQALRTLVMMLRMLNASMGQKRLAVVSKTLMTSFEELIQCIPFFTALGCFAILFNVELGHRLPFFSSLGDSFRVLSFFAFLGDYKSIRDDGWEDSGIQRFKENVYVILFVILYMFFLGNFVLAIVCDSVMVHWNEGKDSATMIDDLQLYYKNRVNRLILKKWPPMERVLTTLLTPEEDRKREEHSAKQKQRKSLSRQMTTKLKGTALTLNNESYDDHLLQLSAGASAISSQRLASLLAVAAKEVEASIMSKVALRGSDEEEQFWKGNLDEAIQQLSANLLRKHGEPSSQGANTTKHVDMHADVQTIKSAPENRIASLQSLLKIQQKMERKQQMATEKIIKSIEQARLGHTRCSALQRAHIALRTIAATDNSQGTSRRTSSSSSSSYRPYAFAEPFQCLDKPFESWNWNRNFSQQPTPMLDSCLGLSSRTIDAIMK